MAHSDVRAVLAAVSVLGTVVMAGCVMHSTTPEYSSAATQSIYQISEREAFLAILDIYAAEMPKQSVDDVVEGKYRGYEADARFALDWTTHRVLVIPVKGLDKDGREVSGYRYDIHSSGSRMFENPLRHKRTRQALEQVLGKTAITVQNAREGEYETDGRAYLGLKRDARDIKLGVPPSRPNNAERLNELKMMREKGLITEDEYETKRRQILDQI